MEPQASPPLLPRAPHRVTSLALDVSGACNLACRYCAEAATQPARPPMGAGTLEGAWRLLFPDGTPRPGSSIHLGSGEPLLAYPLLRQLAAMIDESGGSAAEGRPHVYLTTNGTLADRSVRDWLARSGWYVKVSLDGPRAVHDRWRVDGRGGGTWERVAETVADLAARMEESFSVTAVLCRGADPAEVFSEIAGLGVRRIELVPAVHDDPAVTPGTEEVELYRTFVERYARGFAAARNGGPPLLIRFATRARRAMGHDRARVPCAAGRGFLGVGQDGRLYPCFRFVGLDGYGLGRLPDGVDLGAAAAFGRGAGRPWDERTACADCPAAPLCGGPCFACAETFGPGGGEPVEPLCEYVRADSEWALWLVETLRQLDPERLLRFLPGCSEALERVFSEE